jgi:hypothetical protein
MSMMIIDAWLRNPVTSWNPYKWDEIGRKPYENIEELLEDFTQHGKYSCERYKIFKSWQKRIVGNCFVYCLEMKSEYQLEHSEYNQASYEAEITIVEE